MQTTLWRHLLILISSGLITALPCGGQVLKMTNSLDQMGMVVYQYGSREFDDVINKLVDSEGLTRLSPLLPYCLVVKNGTGRFLAGITILYRLPDFKDKTGAPFRLNGEPFKITTSARTTLRDRKGMFSPGDLRLISPTDPINGTISEAGAVKLRPLVDDTIMRMVDLTLEQLGQGEVYASVDSITTDDALLYGPDDSKLLGKWNARLRAEADLRHEVLALRGTDLRASLLSTSGVQWRSDYYQWKSRAAADWLQTLELVGEKSFVEHLTSVDQFAEIKRAEK
jgi:hypothetical protein